MTNTEKLIILKSAKNQHRSEVHADLKKMDKIQECIGRKEIYIEALQRSIFLLEVEVEKEKQIKFIERNQPASQTGV